MGVLVRRVKTWAIIRRPSERHLKDVKWTTKAESRRGRPIVNRMMLYEMQSNDGARHLTTLCLCRAVHQFFDKKMTLSLKWWPRLLRYVVIDGAWFISKPFAARHRPHCPAVQKGVAGCNEAVSGRGLCSQPKRPAHEHLA